MGHIKWLSNGRPAGYRGGVFCLVRARPGVLSLALHTEIARKPPEDKPSLQLIIWEHFWRFKRFYPKHNILRGRILVQTFLEGPPPTPQNSTFRKGHITFCYSDSGNGPPAWLSWPSDQVSSHIYSWNEGFGRGEFPAVGITTPAWFTLIFPYVDSSSDSDAKPPQTWACHLTGGDLLHETTDFTNTLHGAYFVLAKKPGLGNMIPIFFREHFTRCEDYLRQACHTPRARLLYHIFQYKRFPLMSKHQARLIVSCPWALWKYKTIY